MSKHEETKVFGRFCIVITALGVLWLIGQTQFLMNMHRLDIVHFSKQVHGIALSGLHLGERKGK